MSVWPAWRLWPRNIQNQEVINVTKSLSLESRGQRIKAINTSKTEMAKGRILKGEMGKSC